MRKAAFLVSLVCAAGAFCATVPAIAQEQAPPTTPPPAPAAGHARLEVAGGIRRHGRAYLLKGERVTVLGHVRPYVRGQRMAVRIRSHHRRPATVRAKVTKSGSEGVFRVVFRARRATTYLVSAVHSATPQQVLFSAKTGLQAVAARGAGPGSRGTNVALLKQGLRGLGYPAGSGPSWTGKLGREVMAFRKTNGMSRVFTANRTVFAMVFAGRGAFKLRHPGAGEHVEFDWSRQVLALAEGARVVATYHASSGTPWTPTVFGTFHFYLKGPGTNAKGMFMSNFFVRGYAVHGYPSVPIYPASHGCIRVPNPDAVTIFNRIKIGETIFVYP